MASDAFTAVCVKVGCSENWVPTQTDKPKPGFNEFSA